MTRVVRCGGRRRAGILWLAALWLIPIEVTLLPSFGPIRPAAAQDPGGQDPGGVAPGGEDMPRPTRSRTRSTRKRTRLADRNPQKKAETKGKAAAKDKGSDQSLPPQPFTARMRTLWLPIERPSSAWCSRD